MTQLYKTGLKGGGMGIIKLLVILIFISPFILLSISTPMTTEEQFVFGATCIGLAIGLTIFKKTKGPSVFLIIVSMLMSTRYIYFRFSDTLYFDTYLEAFLGISLFIAEVYIWVMLLLNYFQSITPLKREVQPLPEDTTCWPSVDIYIPTYNEPLQVVRDTVLAAQCIEYPVEKMRIYLLDDGRRNEFSAFAMEAGISYIIRPDNSYAKAGNLNNAMKYTNGELICIFDCDHIPTKMFLQSTVGLFIHDPKLALVQTPHHFYSPDPFERNLPTGGTHPNEGALFYGPIQQGNDNWNAAFFCGSCALLRRVALVEINGFATETVTEDAHTALKIQSLGWNTAFIDIPLAAGLATEKLVLHVIQRTRWARGMTQILRIDNPLLKRGLTLPQRLCYLSAMLYYQFSLPRIIFVTAPLAYLFFDLNIIHASAGLVVSYALPHFILSVYVTSLNNGRYRHSFWGEVYDITLSFHLVLPTLLTFFFPHKGKFNVTDKGSTLSRNYFDTRVVRPHIITASLLFIAILFGSVRAIYSDYFEADLSVILLNIFWAIYSLVFLLASIAVARERKQTRNAVRIDVSLPINIHYSSGTVSRTSTRNISMSGCCIIPPDERHHQDPISAIEIALHSYPVTLPSKVIAYDDKNIRIMFNDDMSLDKRRELVRFVFCRADAWISPGWKKDRPLNSFISILLCAFSLILPNFLLPKKYHSKPTGSIS